LVGVWLIVVPPDRRGQVRGDVSPGTASARGGSPGIAVGAAGYAGAMTHPEHLPPPGELRDTPESLTRLFVQVDAALRDAADWREGRTVSNGPAVEIHHYDSRQ
jgi:hypothetical protein